MDERTQMTKEELEQFNKELFTVQRQMTDEEKEQYMKQLYDCQRCAN